MSGWPVEIRDRSAASIRVFPGPTTVALIMEEGEMATCVCLTPAQSATLRAALEAAEQEMS